MLLEQAIFTSSDRSRIKGYHLVARTDGIDRHLAQELSQWSPSQLPHSETKEWILSAFPLAANRIGVSRTVWGGPEYSCRGSVRVVTLISVFEAHQFAAYNHSACLAASTALAFGYLRLPIDTPRTLEPITLPDVPLATDWIPPSSQTMDRSTCSSSSHPNLSTALAETVDALTERKRCAVISAFQPKSLIKELLPLLGAKVRSSLSFTTGLLPSAQRPFQLHFFPNLDHKLRRTLDSLGIHALQLS